MTSDQFRPPSVPDGLLPEEKGEMTTEHPRPPSMPEAAMTAASFQPPAIPDGLCPEEAQKFLEAHGFAHNLKHKTGGSYVYMMVAPVLAPGASLESFILYVNQLLAESGNPTDPLERLLVEQVAMAHHAIGCLYVRAATAETLDQAKLYNAAAARLLGEFRRTVLALKKYREHRGGGWDNYARDGRAAYRDYNLPGFRHFNLGFRVSRVAE